MTKQQLIESLAPYPDNMEVFIDTESILHLFQYNQLNEVERKSIGFSELPGGLVLAKDNVIVLSAL